MPQKRSLCARPTVSRLRRSQRLAARRQQVVGGLATTGENVIPGNKSPIQVPKSGLSAKAPCNVLDISGQERAAQGTLTPLDISALLDLEWKFQSIFQSYSERANRQYRSEESLLLLGNRVRILSWHISKRLRHLNHLMLRATNSQEIQTNIMAKGTEDLKQLCKQMREACNELNATVKTAHPNKKSLSSSFQSMQKSLEQMDQVLSN